MTKIIYVLIGMLLLPTVVYASDVFGERVTMWLIHNYYEEECLEKEECFMNFATGECCVLEFIIKNDTLIEPRSCRLPKCLKWHLVRKVNIR